MKQPGLDSLLKAFKASCLSKAFPEQRKLICDPARWKVALTTRRAAKSTSGALALIDAAQTKGDALYVSLSRTQIRRDFWNPILIPMLEELNIPYVPNETLMAVFLPQSGHWIHTFPVDASDKERRKLRGGKCALVVIDEAQDITTDLADLIESVLQPKLADLKGSLIMLGTPGKLMLGLWFEITSGAVGGWSVHKWSASQNPHIKWDEECAELMKRKPGIDKTARYRREYLGEWVPDDNDFLCTYAEPFNCFGDLPIYNHGKWHFILALDLGWEHPTAMVAMAFHDHDPVLYILESYSAPHIRPSEVADKIKKLLGTYTFEDIVVDPASAQVIAEIEERLGFRLTAAQKRGRDEFIEILNDDFILGKIKIRPSTCQTLVTELKSLLKGAETKDDNFDAMLYGWRRASPFLCTPTPDVPPAPGTSAWAKEEAERMRECARLEVVKKKDQDQNFRADYGFDPNAGLIF